MFRVIKPKIELHIPSFLFKAKNMYHMVTLFLMEAPLTPTFWVPNFKTMIRGKSDFTIQTLW